VVSVQRRASSFHCFAYGILGDMRANRGRTSTYRINFRLKPRRRNPDTDVRISSAKTIRTHSALRKNNAIMTASNIGSSRLWFLFFERIALRERRTAQIVAVHRQYIEGAELGFLAMSAGMQRVEIGDPVNAQDNRLAIDPSKMLDGCLCDPRIWSSHSRRR
jgi:hypothetical protein